MVGPGVELLRPALLVAPNGENSNMFPSSSALVLWVLLPDAIL